MIAIKKLGWISAILLVTAFFASNAAKGNQKALPPDENVKRLESAHKLAELKLPELAIEHLVRVDLDALSVPHLVYCARILRHVVWHSKTTSPRIERQLAQLLDLHASPDVSVVLWETRAYLSQFEAKPAAALDAWDRALSQESDRQKRSILFSKAVRYLLRVPLLHLQYDLEVQNGALRDFLRKWSQLVVSRAEVESMLHLELRLDPEGEWVDVWAKRVLSMERASPRALETYGLVEERRGRPDRSFPWFLWAAYTDSLRSKGSPRYWRRLANAYQSFGWCDEAKDAYRLALEHELADQLSCSGNGTDLPMRAKYRHEINSECKDWHDSLLGYSPESVEVVWAGDWQNSVPDLSIWKSKCQLPEPDPFAPKICNSRNRVLSRGYPRLAAHRLPLVAFPGHWSPSTDLCALKQIILPRTDFLRGWSDRLSDLSSQSTDSPIPEFKLVDGALVQALLGSRIGLDREVSKQIGRLSQLDADWRLDALIEIAVAQHYSPMRVRRTALARALDLAARDATFKTHSYHSSNPRIAVAEALRWIAPETTEASYWAEQAILNAPDEEKVRAAWLNLGLLEISRDRPLRAIPFLIWGMDGQVDVSGLNHTGISEEARRGLAEIYTHLGWWDLALETLGSAGRTVVEYQALDPSILVPQLLPESCRRVHDELANADATAAVLETTLNWRRSVPTLESWEVCASSLANSGSGISTGSATLSSNVEERPSQDEGLLC